MKSPIITAFALFCVAVSAQAQTTYSVIKASASIPCVAAIPNPNANTFTLQVKTTLTTKSIINIALDKDPKTPVPKNVILAFAGNFADFGTLNANANGPMQLVVFDTATSTKLATIATASNAAVADNQIINKFSRVFSGILTFQNTGGVVSYFSSGSLQVGGTAKRAPFGTPDPQTLKISAPCTVVGSVGFNFPKNGVANGDFDGGGIVTKGTLKVSGKILGTFTE